MKQQVVTGTLQNSKPQAIEASRLWSNLDSIRAKIGDTSNLALAVKEVVDSVARPVDDNSREGDGTLAWYAKFRPHPSLAGVHV